MKKYLCSILLIASMFVFGGCNDKTCYTCSSVVEETMVDTYNKIENSVVYIHSTTGEDYDVGSGVIIKEDDNSLYILTNKHVISTITSSYQTYYENIEVRFKDNVIVDATIIGSYATIDVAVIKVNKNEVSAYTVAKIETNYSLAEDVLVYGNPLKIPFVISAGVISSLYSEVDFTSDGLGKYYGIQTDASINPGNSGGGLFNLDGELLGIVQGGNSSRNGVGYAIPIEYAYNIAERLIENGVVDVNEYNFQYSDVRLLDYDALGISKSINKGMYVTSGEYQGKIIKSVNGIEVNDIAEFYMYQFLNNASYNFIYLNLDGSIYQG